MKSPYLHFLKQSTAAVRAKLRTVRHQVPALALAGVASLSLFTGLYGRHIAFRHVHPRTTQSKPEAKEGAFWAIPSTIVQPTGDHWEFGWGTLMCARDVMTGDMFQPYKGGNKFIPFSQVLTWDKITFFATLYTNLVTM